MDRWSKKQEIILKLAQKNQLATDSHHLVEHDPRVKEFPVHSYVVFTPPVGRSDKLVPRHRGPYQVMSHAGAVYTMQFLIRWSGFGEESDSWEPYKTLMHTEPTSSRLDRLYFILS